MCDWVRLKLISPFSAAIYAAALLCLPPWQYAAIYTYSNNPLYCCGDLFIVLQVEDFMWTADPHGMMWFQPVSGISFAYIIVAGQE